MSDSIKLVSLATGETIAAIDTITLVELQKAFSEATGAYHVLKVTEGALGALKEDETEEKIAKALTEALGDRGSLLIGYASPKPEAPWTITGTVRDRQDRPLRGVQVLAYDKDTAKKDDFLGCAFSDEEGYFELHYAEEDFKNVKAIIDFEGNPDVYLHVVDVASGRKKRTATKGEAKQEEHFELKLDFDSETKTLRPVVGYYYIEEDKLEGEIEQLKDRIKADPEDAQSHFLLGLCFLEMMKSDLRKSEWMVPEVRSDDDVLALAAIQEFDEVIALAPERKEEAERYRSYVQELQDLAL